MYLIRHNKRQGWVAYSGPRNKRVLCCTIARELAQKYTGREALAIIRANPKLVLKIIKK